MRGVSRWLAPALASLALAGCGGAVERHLEPLEGYRPASSDAPPFDEAREACEKAAAFRTFDGTEFTDWKQFEGCMKERGWTRDPEPATKENP